MVYPDTRDQGYVQEACTFDALWICMRAKCKISPSRSVREVQSHVSVVFFLSTTKQCLSQLLSGESSRFAKIILMRKIGCDFFSETEREESGAGVSTGQRCRNLPVRARGAEKQKKDCSTQESNLD